MNTISPSLRADPNVDRAGPEWPLDPRSLWPLAVKELRDSLRNKWFLLYALAFGGLAVALAFLSQVGAGLAGFAGFGKTAASLINLTMLVIPLMAITVGALSLSTERDRGMLAYLLAQPVTRAEVFVAKFLGQALAFTGAISLGFGVSALALSGAGHTDSFLFVRLAGLSILLALSMLSIGMCIGTLVRGSGGAVGVSVFAWLGVTLFGDLGLIGATTIFDLEIPQMLTASLFNPTQVFKLASISGFDATLDLLGPVGLYATRTWGGALTPILLATLVAWVVVPFSIGLALFVRRPL